MTRFVVWNVERARPVNRTPLSYSFAERLADRLETKFNSPFLVQPTRG